MAIGVWEEEKKRLLSKDLDDHSKDNNSHISVEKQK